MNKPIMIIRMSKNFFLFIVASSLVVALAIALFNEHFWIDPEGEFIIIKRKNQGIFLIDNKISICYPLGEMLLLKIDPTKEFDYEMFKRSNCRSLF